MSESNIFHSGNSLFGISGGQLEYISQKTVWKKLGDRWVPYNVIRFTDHDVYMDSNKKLIEGKYYELEFPIHME